MCCNDYSFSKCSKLADVYIDNDENNIRLTEENTWWNGYGWTTTQAWNYNTYAYVHFNDCTHAISVIINNKQDYTTMSALAYNYDMKIANAIYPYLVQHGVAETLDKSAVMNYLKEWFIVPSEEMRTAKGKYVPNLGTDSEKSEAFKKQFIKKIFGVSGK